MPTVLRYEAYRIYFYSHEPNEPPHVHIDRDNLSAKFWLNPISLARNRGFSARELRQVERIVRENRQQLLEAWNGVGYCEKRFAVATRESATIIGGVE